MNYKFYNTLYKYLKNLSLLSHMSMFTFLILSAPIINIIFMECTFRNFPEVGEGDKIIAFYFIRSFWRVINDATVKWLGGATLCIFLIKIVFTAYFYGAFAPRRVIGFFPFILANEESDLACNHFYEIKGERKNTFLLIH